MLIFYIVQDHDGSHIKGLLINFIHSFWPSLLKIPSFLVEFITPIVKVGFFINFHMLSSFFMVEKYSFSLLYHDYTGN